MAAAFTFCTRGRTEASWRMQVGDVGDMLGGVLGEKRQLEQASYIVGPIVDGLLSL